MLRKMSFLLLFFPAVAIAEADRNWVMITSDLNSSSHEYYCAMSPEVVQEISGGLFSKPFVLGESCFYYDNALQMKPFYEAGNKNGKFGWTGDRQIRVEAIQRIVHIDNALTEARWEQMQLITQKSSSSAKPKSTSLNH